MISTKGIKKLVDISVVSKEHCKIKLKGVQGIQVANKAVIPKTLFLILSLNFFSCLFTKLFFVFLSDNVSMFHEHKPMYTQAHF